MWRRQHKFTWIVVIKNFAIILPSQSLLGCYVGFHNFFHAVLFAWAVLFFAAWLFLVNYSRLCDSVHIKFPIKMLYEHKNYWYNSKFWESSLFVCLTCVHFVIHHVCCLWTMCSFTLYMFRSVFFTGQTDRAFTNTSMLFGHSDLPVSVAINTQGLHIISRSAPPVSTLILYITYAVINHQFWKEISKTFSCPILMIND